jgi:hypothetical protein
MPGKNKGYHQKGIQPLQSMLNASIYNLSNLKIIPPIPYFSEKRPANIENAAASSKL